MIIYIASPYTSRADLQAAVNVQLDTFAVLLAIGHEPIAPLLSHYVDQRYPASYERWMQWCLAMVNVCDAVLRLPGDSLGADREVARAQQLGKLVFYSLEEIASRDSFIKRRAERAAKLAEFIRAARGRQP